MADLNFPQNPNPGDIWTIGSRSWIWNGSGWALQSGIVSTNPFKVVSIEVTTTTNSTSTNSGAIIVAGGGGFGGNIYAKDIFSNGSAIVTTATIGNFGVSAITAGTDTAVYIGGGNVYTIWNTSTLQSVTDRGATTTNTISVKALGVNTSTDNTFAQVTISGNTTATLGMYNSTGDVGAQIYLGDSRFNNSTKWNSAPGIGATYDTLYGGLAGALGLYTYNGNDNSRSLQVTVKAGGYGVSVHSTTSATSTNTGALQIVNGGVGIGGDLYVGGRIIGGGLRSTTSYIPPNNPVIGDIWYDSSTDVLYRYTLDGSNNVYWLDITGPSVLAYII